MRGPSFTRRRRRWWWMRSLYWMGQQRCRKRADSVQRRSAHISCDSYGSRPLSSGTDLRGRPHVRTECMAYDTYPSLGSHPPSRLLAFPLPTCYLLQLELYGRFRRHTLKVRLELGDNVCLDLGVALDQFQELGKVRFREEHLGRSSWRRSRVSGCIGHGGWSGGSSCWRGTRSRCGCTRVDSLTERFGRHERLYG